MLRTQEGNHHLGDDRHALFDCRYEIDFMQAILDRFRLNIKPDSERNMQRKHENTLLEPVIHGYFLERTWGHREGPREIYILTRCALARAIEMSCSGISFGFALCCDRGVKEVFCFLEKISWPSLVFPWSFYLEPRIVYLMCMARCN